MHPLWLPKYKDLKRNELSFIENLDTKSFKLFKESEIHPHIDIEKSHLFSSIDSESTEIDILNWIHSLIILLKPENILETGTCAGIGTIAFATACDINNLGQVYSIELEKGRVEKTKQQINKLHLENRITIINDDSREYLKNTNIIFNLAFFDSLPEIRAEECEICMKRGILKGPAIFHDTSSYRNDSMKNWPPKEVQDKYSQDIKEISKKYFDNNYFEISLSRGLIILFPKRIP